MRGTLDVSAGSIFDRASRPASANWSSHAHHVSLLGVFSSEELLGYATPVGDQDPITLEYAAWELSGFRIGLYLRTAPLGVDATQGEVESELNALPSLTVDGTKSVEVRDGA